MKTVYQIMHGDRRVARVDTQGRCEIYCEAFLPFGLCLKEASDDIDTLVNNITNFYHWCAGRVFSLDRQYAKAILNSIGASQSFTDRDRAGIALSYRCLTLTDAYWVRTEGETISFAEVNLYRHAYRLVCKLPDSAPNAYDAKGSCLGGSKKRLVSTKFLRSIRAGLPTEKRNMRCCWPGWEYCSLVSVKFVREGKSRKGLLPSLFMLLEGGVKVKYCFAGGSLLKIVICPEEMKWDLPGFYEEVARLAGLTCADHQHFDCRELEVSEDVQR